MRLKQLVAAFVSAACSLFISGPAPAQAYLTQPVKIVVPTGPGSIADTVTRLIAQGLSTQLSQPFIVENRVGANGIVGADAVAKAPADGTTMIVGNVSTHAINAALYAKLPYDPVRDFSPVSLVGFVPYILVVADGVPAKNIAELLELARSRPGKLTYATGSAPSIVAMEMIKRAAGVDVLQVNYKTVPQGMIDVLSGRIDMMVADTGVAIPQIRTGKVRAVLTAASARTPLLPDVPSLTEAGLPKLDVLGWWGWYAPAGTPPAAVNRVYEALVKVTGQKPLQERVAEFGAELRGGSPAELTAFTHQQSAMYARIIKEAGIKPE
jgi:tripartite-type tricarboxylate transporter receptor subunit TctC